MQSYPRRKWRSECLNQYSDQVESEFGPMTTVSTIPLSISPRAKRNCIRLRKNPNRGHCDARLVRQTTKATAEAAGLINEGLKLFKEGQSAEALQRFNVALEMQLTLEEEQAAWYNRACALCAEGDYASAAESLENSLDKGVSFAVAMADSDLAPLRETTAFRDIRQKQLALRPMQKGKPSDSNGPRKSLALQAEARAPFRPVRLVFYLSLGTAAALAALVTIPRVIIALQSSEDISLAETLKNLAIDIGGVALFSILFRWDLSKNQETLKIVSREESLAELKIELKTGKKIAVGQLRDRYRPIILYGDSKTIQDAEQGARKYLKDLTDRGVILIKVPKNHNDDTQENALKGFGQDARKKGQPQTEDEEITSIVAASMESASVKFIAAAADIGSWKNFLDKEIGTKDESMAYIFLRLDGRVRESGTEIPNWQKIVSDVPKTSDQMSKVVQ